MVKKLEEMTLDDARNILVEWKDCAGRQCCGCPNDSSNNPFGKSCSKVTARAVHVVGEELERRKTDPRTVAETSIDKYQSTIASMKNSGYDHCYMCGARFGEG